MGVSSSTLGQLVTEEFSRLSNGKQYLNLDEILQFHVDVGVNVDLESLAVLFDLDQCVFNLPLRNNERLWLCPSVPLRLSSILSPSLQVSLATFLSHSLLFLPTLCRTEASRPSFRAQLDLLSLLSLGLTGRTSCLARVWHMLRGPSPNSCVIAPTLFTLREAD